MKKTQCPDYKGVGVVPANSEPIPQADGRMLILCASVCDRCEGSGEVPVIADVLAVFGKKAVA